MTTGFGNRLGCTMKNTYTKEKDNKEEEDNSCPTTDASQIIHPWKGLCNAFPI